MPNEYVTQREFDQYTKATDRELARLNAALEEHGEQHETDADHRRTGLAQRIAGIAAGAAVVSACVVVIELWLSSGK